MTVMTGERGREPSSRRWWRFPLAAVIGLLAGALGTVALLNVRRAAAVAFLAPTPDARVMSARGRAIPSSAGATLAAGDRVQAGATVAAIATASGAHIDLGPRGQITMLERGVVARLEQGGMVIDAVAAVEQLRVTTAAGEVMVTGARVELNVTAPGGHTGIVAFVHVEQGTVRLESAGHEVVLAGDERGVLATGHPPSNVSFIIPANRAVTLPGPPDDVPLPVSGVAVAPVAVPVVVATPPITADLVPGGDIRGEVELVGSVPAAAGGTGACAGGDPPWAGDRGRLKNVYVRISSPLALRRSAGAVTVSRQGCVFTPRVASATVGQSLTLSGDGAGIQIFSGPELVFSSLAPTSSWTIDRDGIFRLQAGRGGAGYVAISPHPFAAITGADGTFHLSNVPPGNHTITAWHELGGERSAEVLVVAGRTAEVHFSYEGERPLLTAAAPVAAAPPTELRPAPPAEPRSPPPAEPVPPPAAVDPHDGRCHIANDGSIIGQACQAGGIAQARAVMKELVAVARRRGARVECESCHADDNTFALLPVGRERLMQMLGFVSTPLVNVDPRAVAPPARKRHGH
jgi:hypothetical protein